MSQEVKRLLAVAYECLNSYPPCPTALSEREQRDRRAGIALVIQAMEAEVEKMFPVRQEFKRTKQVVFRDGEWKEEE